MPFSYRKRTMNERRRALTFVRMTVHSSLLVVLFARCGRGIVYVEDEIGRVGHIGLSNTRVYVLAASRLVIDPLRSVWPKSSLYPLSPQDENRKCDNKREQLDAADYTNNQRRLGDTRVRLGRRWNCCVCNVWSEEKK